MQATLILQSQRQPLPKPWLQACLDSAKAWAVSRGYRYRFIADELFEVLPTNLRAMVTSSPAQRLIASDLARLMWMRRLLAQGWQRVIWLDADTYVWDPDRLVPSEANHGVGREVWIQVNQDGAHRAYVKVHNAYLQFDQQDEFLPFYLATALKLVVSNVGDSGVQAPAQLVPQFVGPKLLTALHNIVGLSVVEEAGMLSPLVQADLLTGTGAALALFNRKSRVIPAAVNLCSSLVGDEGAELVGKLQRLSAIKGDRANETFWQ